MFSNDVAADAREDFRDLVASGMEPQEAIARLVIEYGVGHRPDDNDFWLALAVTSHKLGRLTDQVRLAALRVLDDTAELARWPEASRRQRRTALEKARAILEQPQPVPGRVKPRKKVDTALLPGQHVRWALGHGKPDALFRVLDLRLDRGGRYPMLVALRWDGSERSAARANRLQALPGGFDPARRREVALGFWALGRPSDPPGLVVLDATSDQRTPDVSRDRHQYVVAWTDMHRFFTVTGDAAVPL